MKKIFIQIIILVMLLAVTLPVQASANTTDVSVQYTTHCQSYGWMPWESDGNISGTIGKAKRVESIQLKLDTSKDLSILYSGYIEGKGWTAWNRDGELCGTTGEAKRLEAIKIKLVGKDADDYNIYYCTHIQSYGWLSWAQDGDASGSVDLSKRLEAIRVMVLPKNSSAPKNLSNYDSIITGKFNSNIGETVDCYANENIPNVTYQTHVQTYGWLSPVFCGQLSGTTGEAKRMESMKISLSNKQVSGDITYRTHVQTYGWLPWVKNGELSGTTGEAKRLESIQIKLTGDLEKLYDVYYRVHCQTYGWLPWVKNGELAGTTGEAKRLESIEIQIVPKTSTWYELAGSNLSENLIKSDLSTLVGKATYQGVSKINVYEINGMQVAVAVPTDMSSTTILAVAKKINISNDTDGNVKIKMSSDGTSVNSSDGIIISK